MKNIVAFDVETTGLSFKDDYIIQISAVKFDTDFNIIGEFDRYVIPNAANWTIDEGAFEKHGLTKEFIENNGVDLWDAADEFLSFIDDCNLLSYNGKGFDVKMISKDFKSVGLNFDLNRVFFDSYLLETKLRPRTLDNVYKYYTGKNLDNAHNSLYDVKATIDVFHHQVADYAEQGISLDDIMEFDESKIFCIDGMIKKDGDDILFAKGKYKDEEFMSVCKKDKGYIKWFMTNKEFDDHTKEILKKYYAEHRNS